MLSKIKEAHGQSDTKYEEKVDKLNESLCSISSILERISGFEGLNEIEFLRSHNDREAVYASVNQQTEEVAKPPLLAFNKKTVVEALSKSFQGLLTETRHEKKVSSINVNSYTAINNHAKKPS